MLTRKEVEIAYENIKDDILKTPLLHSPKLSELSGANVYLKMESLQLTSSFKIRGVLNKLHSLEKADFDKTFVAASTGNHAAAFGYASEKFNFKGKLFLPENIAPEKLKGISQYTLDKVLHGSASMEAEAKATQYARENDCILVHPYNDAKIIAGQGTIGLEVAAQLPLIDTIIAPIGGGGLISGISAYFSGNDNIAVVGCQPKNASEMFDSIKANKIVPPSTLSTIADAAAGGIEDDSLTFAICKSYLSTIEVVEEEAIKKAVAFLHKYHDIIVEPTAALSVAALLKSTKYRNKNVALVLTGNKISNQLLTEIIQQYGDSY